MNLYLKRLAIFFLLLSTQYMNAQDKLQMGVNELQYFYSDNYNLPNNIEFVFSGNPKYIHYFYSDLEEELKSQFLKLNLNISFRYANNKIHYTSKNKNSKNEHLFYLSINKFKVLKKNQGHDRVVKFNFNGMIISKKEKTKMFSFKSIVIAIHDITEKNNLVTKYIIKKIFKK